MRDPKEFRERFQRWKNGENYWEQRGINMNTQQSQDQQADLLTPEQLTAIEAALEYYTSGKDAVDDVPLEITDDNRPNIFQYSDGRYVYQQPGGEETQVTPTAISQSMFDDPEYWDYTDAQGRKYTPKNLPQKQDRLDAGREYTPVKSEINKYFNELAYRAENDPSSILLQGKYTLPAILAPAIGQTAFNLGATPYINSALTSYFTADGLNDMMQGKIDWETALKLSSAGELYTPFKNIGKSIYNKASDIYKDYRINKKYWSLLNTEKPIYYTYFNDKKIPQVNEYTYRGYEQKMQKLAKDTYDSYKVKDIKKINKERALFKINYDKYNTVAREVDLKPVNIEDLAQKYADNPKLYHELQDLFRHNPEYYIHVKTTGVKDPLSQDAVDQFIERQLTSVRGVHADNEAQARQYLTWQKYGFVRPGRDRLNTQGGVYSSNLKDIANAFKNPEKGVQNGYIGILREKFDVDKSLPISQQLKQLRDRVAVTQRTSPTMMPQNPNAVIYEDMYAGNASRGLGGYERSSVPAEVTVDPITLETQLIERDNYPYEIKSLTEYLNQTNQQGRWATNLSGAIRDDDLFIGKSLNNYDDYIGFARQFLKQQKDPAMAFRYLSFPNKEAEVAARKALEDISTTYNTRRLQAAQLKQKAWNAVQRHDKRLRKARSAVLPGSLVGGTLLIGGLALNEIGKDNRFQRAIDRGWVVVDNDGYHIVDENAVSQDTKDLVEKYNKAIDEYKLENNYNRGKDKGIHINPKNRGKFNALKKRTGKTTEQLTHSKNPLTRKRAIFAQNAKKWKKK